MRAAPLAAPLGLAAALGLAAVLLASCAAPLNLARSVDPFELLQPGELAYLRMNGDSARLLAPSLLPAGEGRALAPLLDRTTALALGIGTLPGSALPVEGEPKISPDPSFDAVFLGDYPFRSAALALGNSRAWKAEGRGFFNAEEGLRVAIPGPHVLLATTRALEPFLDRARRPGVSPLPPRFAALADRELLVWIPEPFSGLAESLFGLQMEVPARGLLLYASRAAPPAPGEPAYELGAVFLMRDAEAVRVYRPLLRLAWYGLARFLLGEKADSLLSASFSAEGELYASGRVELPASVLAGALSRIAGFADRPAN